MPIEKKTKKSRRSAQKYPALDPAFNLRSRADLIDYDYINKLSEEEKKWLSDFTEEYTNANFNHSGKKLHKTKLQKRDCYNKNNSRNRDILTRAKASGTMIYLEDLKSTEGQILKEDYAFKDNMGNWDDYDDGEKED